MRLSIGSGVVMIAVGAILAFAIQPPQWIVAYVDVMDLGLVLIWIGALVLALQAYLYMPRRARTRRPPAPPQQPDNELYAPGRFAAPRYADEYQQSGATPPTPHTQAYPAAGAGSGRTAPYRPSYADPPTYPAAGGPYGDPGSTRAMGTPGQDPPTQQMPRQ